MSAFVNDRDVFLEASGRINVDPRRGKDLLLTVDPPTFHVDAAGAGLPAVATWTAHQIGIPGNLQWSATNGAILRGSDPHVRTLPFADMPGATTTVTVQIVFEGEVYIASQTISKVGDVNTEAVLGLLDGKIAEEHLVTELRSRIALVDGPANIVGTTAYRLAQEAAARGDAIAAAQDDFAAAVLSEGQARVDGDVALSQRIDTIVAGNGDATAAVQQEVQARVQGDTALGQRIDTVVATSNNTTAAIQDEAYTRAQNDGALAQTITTVSSTVNGHTASIQTQATSIDGLKVQLVFKVDNNGYVAGFGLASEAVNGTPVSAFAILADKFLVVGPSGPVPMFLVDASGVYMDKASIRELEVSKITSGVMNAEWVLSGPGARIVFNNGATMKVVGSRFGANADLISWFGPSMAVGLCTKANATTYEATDGSAYWGGALRAGTLYNAQRTTQTAEDASVPLGPYFSNGNPRTIVVSYSFDYNIMHGGMDITGYQADGTPTYADIQLSRGDVPIRLERIVGSYMINNEIDGPDSAQISIGGSFTVTETGAAGNYTYTARIVARSLVNITHTSGSSTSQSISQSLGIVSTEI